MKKGLIFLMIGLIPFTLLAQYWGERVTEKSFESSELYFQSYFLNTYGINNFRQVVVGLIPDPFLDLYLNPANLPSLKNRNLFYLDFRGDRTEAPVIRNYEIYPAYYVGTADYYYPYYIDPRWYQDTRREPEPVFSLGVLAYPFSGVLKNVLLGATYQLIYKQEPFYTVPSWIYYGRYGYDAFGSVRTQEGDIPIHDRSVGEDEMLNSGQLFSVFLGNQFSDKLNAALSLSGIIHNRDGSYVNYYADEYGNTSNDDWFSNIEMKRKQEYQHLDLAAGLKYKFSPTLAVGANVGYLTGNADQTYKSINSWKYDYRSPSPLTDYSRSYNESLTSQSWDHEGKNLYGSINLSKELKNKNLVNAYYRYTRSDIDMNNQSIIQDTAYYASHWTYDDPTFYEYEYRSALRDRRNGTGTRENNTHEAMINFQMKLTEKSSISFGGYYSRTISTIHSFEPVVAYRYRSWYDTWYNNYSNDTLSLYEDKDLDWNYHSLEWSLQIPFFLDFQVSPQWTISLGINKVLKSWKIEDETIAYFRIRQRLENDSLKTETNFGERYKEPTKKITEEFTDVIGKFAVQITPQVNIHLLIDPEFDDEFRIAQWWLGFRIHL